jgi:hypothetical protein
LYIGRLAVTGAFRTRPETLEARVARQKRPAFRTGKQGCMYHI